jgi:XTP/dITP diphosphohydrolase
MKFYLGTGNPYKVEEFARILRPLQLGLEVTPALDPDETEPNFEGNALIKARAYSAHMRDRLVRQYRQRCGGEAEALAYLRAARYWTISEDSGLVIPALGGLPGPWSARFADFADVDPVQGKLSGFRESGLGRDNIDRLNSERVIELMANVPFGERAAEFVASLIVVDIDGQALFRGLGRCQGWISDSARGDRGFGYDPIFVHGRMPNHTFAEMDRQRKDLLSHRRRVLAEFTAWLGQVLKDDDRAE